MDGSCRKPFCLGPCGRFKLEAISSASSSTVRTSILTNGPTISRPSVIVNRGGSGAYARPEKKQKMSYITRDDDKVGEIYVCDIHISL